MKILIMLCLGLFVVMPVVGFAKATVEAKEFDVRGLKRLGVENRSGLIRVTATTRAKAVVNARKNEFSKTCRLVMEKKDDLLAVQVKQDGFADTDDCKVDLEIQVPKAVALMIKQGSGDVEINGIEGDLGFKIGSGRVTADGRFPKVEGDSGSGTVRLKGLAGGGVLNSGSGNYELTYAKSAQNGDLQVNVASGNAVLHLPKGSKVQAKLSSVSGRVTNELGETENADFKINMSAASGNLTVKSY